ncbi:lipid-A-disaccharide synthase [candidate division KSB1 bacterium 4484_188]|nr:MAG: lipid-A-disaccharide synthase [candidate division KSB1 bacterium 4484_188]
MNEEKILIIAGEASGDRHAADLVQKLKDILPGAKFYGIGGDAMAARGVELFYHIQQMAFLGFVEVLRHLPFIKKVFRFLEQWMKSNQPRAVILVDYPGFNLRLAKIAKKLGIPVVYYICPQLWAWGEKRVEKIRRFVDLPLVIFQFEADFYARHGIRAVFVGHPLLDEIQLNLSEEAFRKRYDLNSQNPVIALLPGSRPNEINTLLPELAEVVKRVSKRFKTEWVLGKAPAISSDFYREMLKSFPVRIKIVENDVHHLMRYARVAIVASGTATLETGFLGTPMIVLYRVSPLTYLIGKKLVKIKNIALVNIVAGKTIVPELIQHEVKADIITRELERYFTDEKYYKATKQKLSRIRNILGEPGAAERAAQEIATLIE